MEIVQAHNLGRIILLVDIKSNLTPILLFKLKRCISIPFLFQMGGWVDISVKKPLSINSIKYRAHLETISNC